MKKGTKNRQKNFVNAQKYGDDFFVVSFEGKNALDEFLIHMHFFQGEEKGRKGYKNRKKNQKHFFVWKNWELS